MNTTKGYLNYLLQKSEDMELNHQFYNPKIFNINSELLNNINNLINYTKIGKYFWGNKDYDKSLSYYKKIQETIHQEIQVTINNAIQEIKTCQKSEKKEQFQKILHNLKNFSTALTYLNNLRALPLALQNKEKYIMIVERLLSLSSDVSNLYDLLLIYNKININFQDSSVPSNIIKKAISLSKSDLNLFYLALIYKETGQNEQADRITSHLYFSTQDPKVIHLFRVRSPKESEYMCKRVLQSDPNNIYIKNLLCASLADQQSPQAIPTLKQCIKQHGISPFTLVIYSYLQKDIFFNNRSFLKMIQQKDPKILNSYRIFLSQRNIRRDKISIINRTKK